MMAIAVIVLLISLFVYHHSQKFIQSASRAQGTVTRLVKKSDGSDSDSSYPVYTFEDSQGKQHEIYSSSGSYPPAYSVGEKVTVLYQPDDPQNAEMDSFMDKWFFSVMLAGFGLLDLLLGLVLFTAVFIIKKMERPIPSPARI